MSAITERETLGIQMAPLFEVAFGERNGGVRISELLPASGFEEAQRRAVRIAEAHGLVVMGIMRSPWRVITEPIDAQ